jgi:hypothetical protein
MQVHVNLDDPISAARCPLPQVVNMRIIDSDRLGILRDFEFLDT